MLIKPFFDELDLIMFTENYHRMWFLICGFSGRILEGLGAGLLQTAGNIFTYKLISLKRMERLSLKIGRSKIKSLACSRLQLVN